MLVCEQAEAQAREQADAPVITVMSARLAPGRDRHRRGPVEGAVRPPGDRHRRDRGRDRQGLRPLDLRRRPRRGRPRGEGKRAADRRRRARNGGGADRCRRMGSSRSAISSTSGSPPTSRSRAATARFCSMRCSPPAEWPAPCATRSTAAGPYGAGWPSPRIAAGPVRLLKTGDRRRRPCARNRRRRRWQELQVDRLPKRDERARRGAARFGGGCAVGGSPARSSATNGTAAMPRRCTSTTPRSLDALRTPRLTGEPPSRPHRLAV